MLRKIKWIVFLLLVVAHVSSQNDSAQISFNGQVTAWTVGQFEDPFAFQLGGRFVPSLLGDFSLSSKGKIDFEASANINGSVNFTGLNFDSASGQMKPYRVWMRYAGSNWELRAGLQKINFGSAKMFRPLMWFDAMDVRDPLQLTDGVYGLLAKYFFKNNANVWLWGLIGNNNRKGYEVFASSQWKPELGGRFQLPAGPGEMAVSTNFRKMVVPDLLTDVSTANYLLNESRIGIDGKWDVGVGLWFESGIIFTDKNKLEIPSVNAIQDMWNVGMDYTFPMGSGLGMTLEYFRYHTGNEFLVNGNSINLIGGMFTLPVSISDNLSAMIFYVPDLNLTYNYMSWGRSYDNWSIYGIAFWNPDVPLAISQPQGKNLFSGKGIQVMVNYNF